MTTTSVLVKSFLSGRMPVADWQSIRLSERQASYLSDLLAREDVGSPSRGMGNSRASLNSITGWTATLDGIEISLDYRSRRLEYRSAAMAEKARHADEVRYFLEEIEEGGTLRRVVSPQGNEVVQLLRNGCVWAIRVEKLPDELKHLGK